MNSHLLSPATLAAMFDVTEEQVMEWRRTYRWPSLKVGRTIRFTPEHVEQIIASHSIRQAGSSEAPVISGQTSRSASRRKAS